MHTGGAGRWAARVPVVTLLYWIAGRLARS
jgi:hypothetical protein